MSNTFRGKIKAFFSGMVWTVLALMLMNIVAQFVVYPVWAKVLGTEKYGDVVYTMSIINIFAISIGSAINYARMTELAKRNTRNGDYNLMLCVGTIVTILGVTVIVKYSDPAVSALELVLTDVLAVVTLWRFYCDVEYRMNLNYKGYFIYYLWISIGYGVGSLVFWQTGSWPLALIPGEIMAISYVGMRGSLFCSFFSRSVYFKENLQAMLILIATNLVSNLVFNGDRILLRIFLNGTVVSIYYLASLIGKTVSMVTTPFNSVIIGFLAKYDCNLTKKLAVAIGGGSAILVLMGTGACLLGSYILIPFLYPNEFEMVKAYFIVANLAQVIYFITNVLTTILLRFAKTKCQLAINITYGVGFCVLCIPATVLWKFTGFMVSIIAVNLIRYAIALWYLFANVKAE